MNKTKLCYLVSSLCNEGPVNVMYNIIQHLDYALFDVSIVTFIPEKKNSRFSDFEQFPIKIYQIAASEIVGIVKMWRRLGEFITKIKPDIVHAHCPRSLYLMHFVGKEVQKAYTIHIYPGIQQEILYGKLKGGVVNALNHYFTKKCDLPIGCAESVADLYMENKGWAIKSIPNGSSLPVWTVNQQEKLALRERFGLDLNRLYFVYVGRFSKEKNPELIADIFSLPKYQNIGLIMLGEGPLWNAVKEKCGENIVLPGFTNDVYNYLKASDFYISASNVEGLANTLLESMSVGLPMLLSNIPSHSEVLGNSNLDNIGKIFDVSNTTDLETKLDLLIKSRGNNLNVIKQHIQNIYSSRYSSVIMSAAYQKEYMGLKRKKTT